MQRDPRFSRRWGFMGYGSTPLHYPLHPSIDRRCCIGVVQRHYTMPGPVVSLCHRIADARLARYGVHERIQSTGFTRFEIPHRAAQFSFVRLHPCLRKGEKRDRGRGKIWIISVETFRGLSRNIERFKQRFGKIHAQKLSPRDTDTRDNLKRFGQ